MSKLLALAAASALLAFTPATARTWQPSPVTLDEAIGFYVRGTEVGDPEEIRQGFLAGSAMYSVGEGGGLSAYPIRTWRAAMAKGPKPKLGDNTNAIVLKDAGPETAVVKILATRGARVFTDYMLLLNYGTGWRIVSKVYANASAQPNADLTAARVPIEAKLASDGDWDEVKLARSLHTRALVYSVEEQSLVIASPAEWGVRYVERRSDKRPAMQRGQIDYIETTGDVGYARWHLTAGDGSVWHDRALIVRERGEWRILALSYSGVE